MATFLLWAALGRQAVAAQLKEADKKIETIQAQVAEIKKKEAKKPAKAKPKPKKKVPKKGKRR